MQPSRRRRPVRRTRKDESMAAKTKSTKRSRKITDKQVERMAVERGAVAARVISPAEVVTGEWVRWKCQFGCGGFGLSLVCPPHTPTPADTRRMLDEFSRAVLFESPRGQTKKIAVELERELFLANCYKAVGLGAGPCRLCESCAFDDGCRHPSEARPSMEACGIDVYATARAQDFSIDVVTCQEAPQHYFGLVLIE